MSDKPTRKGDVVFSDHDKEKLLNAVRTLSDDDKDGCLPLFSVLVLLLIVVIACA